MMTPWAVACRHSSNWLRRIFLWGHGLAGKDLGESGTRQRPEARDMAKNGKGGEKDGES
jgi:hypothetical protein